MKQHKLQAAVAIMWLMISPALFAQITIPNADGSDGQLIVNSGTAVINLANAGTGNWLNTSTSPGNRTYDPTKLGGGVQIHQCFYRRRRHADLYQITPPMRRWSGWSMAM